MSKPPATLGNDFFSKLIKRHTCQKDFESIAKGYNPFIPGDPLHEMLERFRKDKKHE